MKKTRDYRLAFLILIPIGVLFLSNQFNGNLNSFEKSTEKSKIVERKQRGAHIFGILDTTDLQPFKDKNIEWVTLVSWGFQDDFDSPEVTHHNGDSARISEHNEHWINRIKQVRGGGFKVFFKPHLWINHASEGKWRSDVFPSNDEDWEVWKKTYRDFILRYAKVAEAADADMFCIGAELSRLTVEKPLFWKNLIQEIRSVYSGEITYAANWYQEFEKITFWEDLDFIGIQAYFPLVENEYPTVEQISEGWNQYLPTMKNISDTYRRRILFTEMGYKSTSDSAVKPWEWIDDISKEDKAVSEETQANCYAAFFNSIWKKEWFAGVHIWQMRSDFVKGEWKNDLDFSPQWKLGEKVIANGFE